MIQFRLTPRVQALLEYTDDMISEPKQSDAFLGNWYADIIQLGEMDSLLLVCEKTYLSFVLLNIRSEHSDMLANGFINGLDHLLHLLHFAERSIPRLMQGLEVMSIAAATDKKLLRVLDNVGLLYTEEVAQRGGLDHCNVEDVMKRINAFPHPTLGNQSPVKATKTLLRNNDLSLH